MPLRKAIFLDRDGTVIHAIERPDHEKKITAAFAIFELQFYPDAKKVIEELKKLGYLVIMITNQPDVKLGYLNEFIWEEIQRRVRGRLSFDDVMMCRHVTEDNCPFKKPSAMMLLAMADKWGIDLSKSFMIGDMLADTKSAQLAGVPSILLTRSYNTDVTIADYRTPTLTGALEIIKSYES